MHIATNIKLTPEVRRAFAAEMQRLTPSDENWVTELRQLVLSKPDQSLQKSAIVGLERIGSPQAVLVIAQRLCDPWGISAISRAIRSLAKLRSAGGLLALTSTLLIDFRFVTEKLQLVGAVCREAESHISSDWLAEIVEPDPLYTLRQDIPRRIALLREAPLPDVSWGSTLAALLRPLPPWAANVPEPDLKATLSAKAYAERRVPGLVDLLTSGRALVL